MPSPKINKRNDNNEWNKVNKFSAAFDFALCHRQAFGGHLFPEDWLHSGNPNLKIKELGGTGRIHNWNLSRLIRDNSRCPIFLAGGLTSENVKQAIEVVQPFAIDVCSGVRTDGKLDNQKLTDFFNKVSEI